MPQPLFAVDNSDLGIFVLDSEERRCWFAVIMRAVTDTKCSEYILRALAREWLRDKISYHVGSLMWILDHISTDSSAAFKAIEKLLPSS